MYPIRRSVATVAVAGTLLAGGMAAPSYAAPKQTQDDGLVNVQVGNVTILNDINAAALVVANACDIDVLNIGPIVALAEDVDASGKSVTVCKSDAGNVKIKQN